MAVGFYPPPPKQKKHKKTNKTTTDNQNNTKQKHTHPKKQTKKQQKNKKTTTWNKKEGKEGNVLFNDALNTFYYMASEEQERMRKVEIPTDTGIAYKFNHTTSHNKQIRKEGNVLFNDALNTFYLRLYDVTHNMVKDHSDSERERVRKPAPAT